MKIIERSMQIKNQDKKQGLIEVIPESIDDLWHLSHIVEENDFVSTYKEKMDKTFGEGSCSILQIRPVGGIKLF